MKSLLTLFAVLFISVQTYAQDERTPSNNTTTGDDLAQKIANKINACENMTCFVNLYNSFAKVTSGLSNKESGKKIMVAILELMDKKRPGLLFDVYMKADKKYQPYFIKCVKLLPKNLRDEMVRKAKNHTNNSNNTTNVSNNVQNNDEIEDNVGLGETGKKIVNQINSCSDVVCLSKLYNRMAKVLTGKTFAEKPEMAKKVMVFILRHMDRKTDGVLFDVYMKSDKTYQSFFLDCVKLLPKDLRTEMVQKANNYSK